MSGPAPDRDRFTERIIRRETHSSRAVPSGIAALLVILLAVYGLLESALRAVGQPPWLIDPQSGLDALARLPEGVSPALLGALGVVLALLGVVFLLNAVLPGRLARHTLPGARTAVVVDDEVIAAALARRARLAAGVTREQVLVVVSRTAVTVNVRPTSGIAVDEADVLAAVREELAELAPHPGLTASVHLAAIGAVGV
jgi:hypothetical protein